jgi:5-methyltetrahydropteroyltriglutamate--homocysteine methyltransferase
LDGIAMFLPCGLNEAPIVSIVNRKSIFGYRPGTGLNRKLTPTSELAPIDRKMTEALLPTTVVGSYPQPDWLVDRAMLKAHIVPRTRLKAVWRVPEAFLEEAQDDATLIAIRDMERADIDIITDGEIRRESYSNRFATALEGVDIDNPGTVKTTGGVDTPVPRIVGRIKRTGPVEVRDMAFLRRSTDRRVKMTLPGPFTMARQAQNDFYREPDEMVMDFAVALNEEAHALQAAGADVIQLDEPWLRTDPAAAKRIAVKAIDRALAGLTATAAVHLCFGYAAVVNTKPAGYSFLPELADCAAQQISIEAAQPRLDLGILADLSSKTIILGVIDLNDPKVEAADTVAARLRAALRHVPAERLIAAPDCGMKYLPRDAAFGKLAALSKGAKIVRRELS